jgi:hypothetical protein
MVNVIHSLWMGILCATWHKMIPNFTNPKIRFQIFFKWIDIKMFKWPHYKNDGEKNISCQVKLQWLDTKW